MGLETAPLSYINNAEVVLPPKKTLEETVRELRINEEVPLTGFNINPYRVTDQLLDGAQRADETNDENVRSRELLKSLWLIEQARHQSPNFPSELMGEREIRLKAAKYCPEVETKCQEWYEQHQRDDEPDWKDINWKNI